MILHVLLVVAAASAAPQLAAQETRPVTIGHRLVFPSDILGGECELSVYLPEGYERSTERYPVLYLLDGDAHFHHATGLVAHLTGAARIPAMIVVGISSPRRTRDFTPTAESPVLERESVPFGPRVHQEFPESGGARRFLDHLTAELVPFVEGRYRTADFRLLFGHSLGGLFALHALLERPEAFQAIVASSPSLWWDDQALIRRAAAHAFPERYARPHFVYMATGDRDRMADELNDFATALELSDPEGLRWWYDVVKDGEHPSVPHDALENGLEAIFDRFWISENLVLAGDVGRIEARLADASQAYGFELRPPEELLEEMGFLQLELFSNPAAAFEVFRRAAELHPESVDLREALLEAAEAAGREPPASSPQMELARADRYFSRGRFDEASDLYEKMPSRPEGTAMLGDRPWRAHLALGLTDRAAAYRPDRRGLCERALVDIFAADTAALAARTDSLTAQGLERAEDLECAAFNEVFLGRYDEATLHLERLAGLEPGEPELNLGFLYLLSGRAAEGERILLEGETRALRDALENPESWEPYFDLAEIASMRQDVDAAVAYLHDAFDRGLEIEWWIYQLFSADAMPDPVFRPLYGDPAFEAMRSEVMLARMEMRDRVLGVSTR